jgi:hypothetical protein
VEALRNPGHPILNADRPEGAEGNTSLRGLLPFLWAWIAL